MQIFCGKYTKETSTTLKKLNINRNVLVTKMEKICGINECKNQKKN